MNSRLTNPGGPSAEPSGDGSTDRLTLRVSVATLTRVVFEHPVTGDITVALERTATLVHAGGRVDVEVAAKPFGGAVRLKDSLALERRIGKFRYDGEQSSRENDFRLLIAPNKVDALTAICLEHLADPHTGLLDPNPERELVEEFNAALAVPICGADYRIRPEGLVTEAQPVRTESVRMPGHLSMRFYYISEAYVSGEFIIASMLAKSRRVTSDDLRRAALADARQGGKGRASSILMTPLKELEDVYEVNGKNSGPVLVQGCRLRGNVPAILPKYRHPGYRYHDPRPT